MDVWADPSAAESGDLCPCELLGEVIARGGRRDAEIVRDTPGMFAEFHGALGDNWIVGKLTAQSWNQELTLSNEGRLAVDWLRTIGEKMLVVVAGNHDVLGYDESTQKLLLHDNLFQVIEGKRADIVIAEVDYLESMVFASDGLVDDRSHLL